MLNMSAMETIEVRPLSKDAQQLLRRQVVAARQEAKTYAEIHAIYGVQVGTASYWWKRYQGEAFLRQSTRPAEGERRPADAGAVRPDSRADHRSQPEHFKLPFALWTHRPPDAFPYSRAKARRAARTGSGSIGWGLRGPSMDRALRDRCARANLLPADWCAADPWAAPSGLPSVAPNRSGDLVEPAVLPRTLGAPEIEKARPKAGPFLFLASPRGFEPLLPP